MSSPRIIGEGAYRARPHLAAQLDDFDARSEENGLLCLDPTRTQQHQEAEANINNIVKRFTQTGELPTHNMPPRSGDFTDAPDYQTALNLMVAAQNSFMEQPADVRARFDNDPAKFVEFCSNDNNADDMRKMGLLSAEAIQRHEQKQAAEAVERAMNKKDAEQYRTDQKSKSKT